jgi:O-antigen ligase
MAAPLFVAVVSIAPILWYSIVVDGGWLRAFFVAALLLPPLAAPWGDSGPHIAVLFAAVGFVAVLIRGGNWRGRWLPLDLALVSYAAALALSVGFAAIYSGAAMAANSAVRVALFGISLLVYFGSRAGDDKLLRPLFAVALAAAAIGCLDYWFQLPAPAGYGPQYVWLDSGVYRRAQGLFYESSTLGTFCSFFLVMIAVASAERRWRQWYAAPALFAAAAIFGLALLLSYSRGAMAATVVALICLAILERKRWLRPRVLIGAAICGAAIAGVFLLAFPEFAQSYWARLAFTFDNALSRPDRVLSGRLENWNTLADFVSAHPWQTFFGIGYKTLAYTEHLGRPVIADNAYLSTLIETGVAGFVSLIFLNAAILYATWRQARKAGNLYGKWICCFWTGFTVQMMSGDVLTYWRILPAFFWVLSQAMPEAGDADSAA